MDAKLVSKQAVEATVEVKIPAQEVDRAFDRALREIARQVKIPGFRPGKAPTGVLIKRVGLETLQSEVREDLIERSYRPAMQEFDLLPVHAHVHGGNPSQGEDFVFEFHVDLYPEVELPDVQQIVIDSERRALDESMVAGAVERLRDENATLVPVERPVEAGDYLLVESLDDAGGEGGSTMPIDLEAVSPELAEQLLGRSMGEVVTLRLAAAGAGEGAAADAAAGEGAAAVESAAEGAEGEEAEAPAAGDPPTLRVRISDIKAKEKPEPGEEFAKTLGFDSWEEVLDRVRRSLEGQLEQEAYEAQREELIDKLVAETTFELPPSLVGRRRAALLENLVEDLRRRGMTMESYLESLEERGGREEFERELREAAEKGVRRDLVLERLVEARGVTVGDDELNAELRRLAAQQGMDVQRLRRERGEEWVDNYRYLMARERALRDTLAERLQGGAAEAGAAAAGDETGAADREQQVEEAGGQQ